MTTLVLLALLSATPAQSYATASSTCAAMPLRNTGTIYYFCDCQTGAEAGCVAGNDANAGTSAASPKQTWAAAIGVFNAMSGGDTIAFCRGGSFAVGTTGDCTGQIGNASCAAGTSLTDAANTSTCDIRDYQASWGGSNRPRLYASTTGITNIISRGLTTTNGVRVLNLEFRGGGNGPRGGTYYHHNGMVFGSCSPNANGNVSWLICNNDFNHLKVGMEGRGAVPAVGFVIWGNRFTEVDLDAMLMGPGSNGKIDSNFFDNVGCFPNHPLTGNNAHIIYLTSDGAESANVQVVNNEFRRSDAAGTAGVCAAAMIMDHERWEGLNVENNIIDGGSPAGNACWAMDFSHGGVHPTYNRHVTIRRNWISSGGAGIALGQATNSTIEDNVIVQLTSSGWKVGMLVPYATSGSGDDVSSAITVRNNTVYQLAGGSDGIRADVAEGTGHIVANNALQMPSGTCYTTTLDPSAYTYVGGNSCYGGAAAGQCALTGSCVTTDPLFTSAPTDFTLQGGSPLLGAGSATYGSSTDYVGAARPNPPAIGAFDAGGAGTITVTSIDVTPVTASISVGSTQQFACTATYSDTSTAACTVSAAWTSSQTGVATVGASSGLATGVGAGTSTIQAAFSGYTDTGSLVVTSNPAPPPPVTDRIHRTHIMAKLRRSP